MELMQFKGYTWPYNPRSLQINLGRDLRTRQAWGLGPLVSDWGREAARIQGEGEFFGEDCLKQYEKLRQIFLEEGSGRLILPSFTPLYAYFEELTLVGEGPMHTLTYRFSFLEDRERMISGGNTLAVKGAGR